MIWEYSAERDTFKWMLTLTKTCFFYYFMVFFVCGTWYYYRDTKNTMVLLCFSMLVSIVLVSVFLEVPTVNTQGVWSKFKVVNVVFWRAVSFFLSPHLLLTAEARVSRDIKITKVKLLNTEAMCARVSGFRVPASLQTEYKGQQYGTFILYNKPHRGQECIYRITNAPSYITSVYFYFTSHFCVLKVRILYLQ